VTELNFSFFAGRRGVRDFEAADYGVVQETKGHCQQCALIHGAGGVRVVDLCPQMQ
jgi:hypothetical protein